MRTAGLLVVYAKCIRASEEPEWDKWEDDVHLPALCTAGGPWVATRFELTARPQLGMPGIGFTHVTIYELDGTDVAAQAACTLDADDALRAAGACTLLTFPSARMCLRPTAPSGKSPNRRPCCVATS